MTKTIMLTTVILALSASAALAQTAGVNLSWDECGDGGVLNKAFACNSNSGTNVAVGSFVAPDGITQLTGTEMTLDVVAEGDSLPNWWQFKNAGACRQSGLGVNFIYAGSSCEDYWSSVSGATGGVAAYVVGEAGANTARITLVAAVDQMQATALTGGTEYFDFNLTINKTKTVGTGACAGCSTPVTITLSAVNLTQPVGVGDVLLTDAASRNYITWQGGAGLGPSAPQRVTYGQIRSIYR